MAKRKNVVEPVSDDLIITSDETVEVSADEVTKKRTPKPVFVVMETHYNNDNYHSIYYEAGHGTPIQAFRNASKADKFAEQKTIDLMFTVDMSKFIGSEASNPVSSLDTAKLNKKLEKLGLDVAASDLGLKKLATTSDEKENVRLLRKVLKVMDKFKPFTVLELQVA